MSTFSGNKGKGKIKTLFRCNKKKAEIIHHQQSHTVKSGKRSPLSRNGLLEMVADGNHGLHKGMKMVNMGVNIE